MSADAVNGAKMEVATEAAKARAFFLWRVVTVLIRDYRIPLDTTPAMSSAAWITLEFIS
jgi:hypothetical protein